MSGCPCSCLWSVAFSVIFFCTIHSLVHFGCKGAFCAKKFALSAGRKLGEKFYKCTFIEWLPMLSIHVLLHLACFVCAKCNLPSILHVREHFCVKKIALNAEVLFSLNSAWSHYVELCELHPGPPILLPLLNSDDCIGSEKGAHQVESLWGCASWCIGLHL